MNPEPYVNPPVFTLIMVSNFLAIIFGIIFKDMLEYQTALWNANRDTQRSIRYQTPNTVIAYSLLTLFLTIFMGAGMSVFGLGIFAYGLAVVVVVPTALLIWLQLGSMLSLLVQGGSEAMDIDSYGAGEKYDVQAPGSSSAE